MSQVQTVFKAGNSNVVAIPQSMAKELGLSKGSKVVVDTTPDGEALVVRKATKSKQAAQKEFKQWLKVFMKENGAILDELAVR